MWRTEEYEISTEMKNGEFIHHYTNVSTLALILKNRTIRFNRLDRVDDISEAQTVSGIQFGKYFFVSCWTHSESESIPLWNMYTRDMAGVRISLPRNPFKWRSLEPDPKWGLVQKGNMLSPIPLDKMFTDQYLILPTFLSSEAFGGNVQYVDNPIEVYTRSVRIENPPSGGRQLAIDNFPFLGRYKTKIWAFQEEFRFVIFILPSLPLKEEGIADRSFLQRIPEYILQCFRNGIDPGIHYFDADIDTQVLDQMIVTLGPMCSEGDRIVVESLVEKYAKSALVRNSVLSGTIRGS